MSVVSARNLSVTLPSRPSPVRALSGVNTEIAKGQLFVLLGPNGAGKTTLMRCITGLILPTEGTISVFADASRTKLSRLGVLIENSGVYGKLNAFEYLTFFGGFFEIKNLSQRIKACAEAMGLALDQKPVAKLSQGNRQKLHLVRSVLHCPELLLWDEPTDHLDPVSQQQILGYLKRYLAESGATALVATHRLEQMESVATHFGFLANGKLVQTGSRESILQTTGATRIRLGFELGDPENIIQTLTGLAKIHSFQIENLEASLVTPISQNKFSIIIQVNTKSMALPSLLRILASQNLPLGTFEPILPTLADAYTRWIGV